MVCSDDVLHDGILIHSAVKSNENLCVVERGGASGHNGDRVVLMIIHAHDYNDVVHSQKRPQVVSSLLTSLSCIKSVNIRLAAT